MAVAAREGEEVDRRWQGGDASGLGVAREVVAEDLGLYAVAVGLSQSRKEGTARAVVRMPERSATGLTQLSTRKRGDGDPRG
jgi:hypothetical protein